MAKVSRKKRLEKRAKIQQNQIATTEQPQAAAETTASATESTVAADSTRSALPRKTTALSKEPSFVMDYQYVYTEARSMLLTTAVMIIIMVVLSYIVVF